MPVSHDTGWGFPWLDNPLPSNDEMTIFKNILYMARRFKWATALNLVGLIVAFAAFYVLMTQVIYQVTYNKGVDDYERIYRLESDFVYNEWQWSDAMCRPIADDLARLPQVEAVSLMSNKTGISGNVTCVKDDVTFEFPFIMGNNDAVSALTRRVVDGNIQWTDSDRTGIIIPASIAREYFGTTSAAGKEMIYEGGVPIKVRGVYEDFPENCVAPNAIVTNLGDIGLGDYNFAFTCLVKVREGVNNVDSLIQPLKQSIVSTMLQSLPPELIGTKAKQLENTNFQFTPLRDTYFAHSTYSFADSGYRSMLLILEVASLLILIVAAINFLNFTLAESPMRVRSLNTRLVMGASRRSLRLGIVAECVITALIAAVLAMGLCHLLAGLSADSDLIAGDIALGKHLVLVAAIIVLAVVIGIVAGTYPAIFATSYPTAMALKTSLGLTPQGRRLRQTLVCLQLVVSVFMITYIGILLMQSHYIFESDYGYDKDQVLYTALEPGENAYFPALRETLMQVPGVERVGYSAATMGANDSYSTLCLEDSAHFIRFMLLPVDYDYLRTMGIKIVEGRDFDKSDPSGDCCIINEAARKKWDWMEMNKPLGILDSSMVVGVCENIRYGTTRIGNNQPVMFVNTSKQGNWLLNVRIAPDADRSHIEQQIAAAVLHCSNHEAGEVHHLDQMFDLTYHNEFRYFKQVLIITLICLIITLIGVFCLTLFETEYRRKEISIRKVSGANSGEIIVMFCRHYARLLLISWLIGAPLAYFVGKLTLAYFAERTTIHWWIFPLSLLLVGLVTLGTVVIQSWRTAHENPATSIKAE